MAWDTQYRYLYWSPLLEQLSGRRADEVVGRCVYDVFPELRSSDEDQCLRRALAGEDLTTVGRRYPSPKPGEGHLDGHYSPIMDEHGAVIGAFAVIRDNTHRSISDQRLRETENRFRNMADIAPVLLWMAEPDGLCTFFNQTWLEFTGRTLEQEWGVGWAAGVYFEDFQRCMDTYVASFNARCVFEMEYRLRRADGEYRWILDRGTRATYPMASSPGSSARASTSPIAKRPRCT